jgi:uncharacterized protein
MPTTFINLPVADLERSQAFYTAIGFPIAPAFSGEQATCFVVDDGHMYLMVSRREFLASMANRPIGDPADAISHVIIVYLDDRAAVDAAIEAGIAAGGTETDEPTDYGFMFQRQLTDPDGNVIELGHMAPAADAPPTSPAAEDDDLAEDVTT